MSEEINMCSVLVRVQKVTYEDAYISVPLVGDVIKINPDNSTEMDMDAFTEQAIRISENEKVAWKIESITTDLHPIQGPKPEDREQFDGYHMLQNEP